MLEMILSICQFHLATFLVKPELSPSNQITYQNSLQPAGWLAQHSKKNVVQTAGSQASDLRVFLLKEHRSSAILVQMRCGLTPVWICFITKAFSDGLGLLLQGLGKR